jgi:hypothetical protein
MGFGEYSRLWTFIYLRLLEKFIPLGLEDEIRLSYLALKFGHSGHFVDGTMIFKPSHWFTAFRFSTLTY